MVLKSKAGIAGLAALLISAAGAVIPEPVYYNGNSYEFVEVIEPPVTGFQSYPENSWASADAAARSSTFMGVSGHLATVDSQAENDVLYSLVEGDYTGFAGAWLGGKEPDGWIAGPENGDAFTYTNWNPGEPNNDGYLYMAVGHSCGGCWFDDSDVSIPGDGQGIPTSPNDPVIGYFIEYEGVGVRGDPSSGSSNPVIDNVIVVTDQRALIYPFRQDGTDAGKKVEKTRQLILHGKNLKPSLKSGHALQSASPHISYEIQSLDLSATDPV